MNVSALDGTNHLLKCAGPTHTNQSEQHQQWHGASMHGVVNGFSGTLAHKVLLGESKLAATSAVQKIQFNYNTKTMGGVNVGRGDLVVLVNTGRKCKIAWPLSTYTDNTCHTHINRNDCHSTTNTGPLGLSEKCYWDPWTTNTLSKCVAFRSACFSNYLTHDIITPVTPEPTNAADNQDEGLWYAPMYNFSSDGMQVPEVVSEKMDMTLWQCGMKLYSLMSEIECEDLCTYDGATTTVDFQCCNGVPCSSPPLITAVASDTANISVPYAFERTTTARLHTVSVHEVHRGLSGTSVNSNGKRNPYVPYSRCTDDVDRVYEQQVLVCNASKGTFQLKHHSTNKNIEIFANSSLTDLKESLRYISNGKIHGVHQQSLNSQQVRIPLVRGSGGTSHVKDRIQILGEPIQSNGIISKVTLRLTNVTYFKFNRHYLYVLKKSSGTDWIVKSRAIVHTSATTDILTAVVEQESATSSSSSSSSGSSSGLQVETGDYVGLINVGWEIASGKLCSSITTRNGCITESKGECFWDENGKYYYTKNNFRIDGVSDIAWGPNAAAFETSRCRLRQEYAQLWLDTQNINQYQHSIDTIDTANTILGVFSDAGASSFLKVLAGAYDPLRATHERSKSGWSGITSHAIGSSLPVRGWSPNAQAGFQLIVDPHAIICNPGEVLHSHSSGLLRTNIFKTIITFTDPLDAGPLPLLSIGSTTFPHVNNHVEIDRTQQGFANQCPILTSHTTIQPSNDAAIAITKDKKGYGGRSIDKNGKKRIFLNASKSFFATALMFCLFFLYFFEWGEKVLPLPLNRCEKDFLELQWSKEVLYCMLLIEKLYKVCKQEMLETTVPHKMVPWITRLSTGS